MKAKWFLISAFALFTGLSMVSCSSDDDPAPVFPEKEDPIKINANETKELSFTANMDWTISVDKNWVGIVEADMAQSYKGAAGNIKFTVNVKDINWGFIDDVATISLTMGGKTETIFEINRPANVRKTKMFIEKKTGSDYAEATEVNIEFKSEISLPVRIGFYANYDWMLILPEGVNMTAETLVGSATNVDKEPTAENLRESSALISMDSEFLASAFEGKIVIKDQNSDYIQEFTLKYKGMGEEDFFFITDGFNFYNGIEFTKEGFFIERKGSQEPTPTDRKEASLSVRMKDMKYSRYLVEINEYMMPVEVDEKETWIKINEETTGNLKISVTGENNEKARKLFLLALPENLVTDPIRLQRYFNFDGEPTELGEKYTMSISQKGEDVAGGFFVGWGSMQEEVPAGSIVPFTEYYPDSKPSDRSLPDETYVYEFSNANINGNLWVAPLNSPVENPGWYFRKQDQAGAWNEIEIENTNVWGANQNGIGVSKIANTITEERSVYLVFYDSEFDYEMWRPSRALILVQKP